MPRLPGLCLACDWHYIGLLSSPAACLALSLLHLYILRWSNQSYMEDDMALQKRGFCHHPVVIYSHIALLLGVTATPSLLHSGDHAAAKHTPDSTSHYKEAYIRTN